MTHLEGATEHVCLVDIVYVGNEWCSWPLKPQGWQAVYTGTECRKGFGLPYYNTSIRAMPGQNIEKSSNPSLAASSAMRARSCRPSATA